MNAQRAEVATLHGSRMLGCVSSNEQIALARSNSSSAISVLSQYRHGYDELSFAPALRTLKIGLYKTPWRVSIPAQAT